MKIGSFSSIVASIIPAFLAILFTLDIYDVILGKGDYPFGIDMIEKHSVYSSRNIYILYDTVLVITSLAIITLAVKRKWKWYSMTLIFLLLLIYLPK